MVNKNEAVKLREQGHSYPQISTLLGCSVSWCKKNLASVTQTSKHSDDNTTFKEKIIKILEASIAAVRSLK